MTNFAKVKFQKKKEQKNLEKLVKTLCDNCQVKCELRFDKFFKDKVSKKQLEKIRENTLCKLSSKM